MKDKDTVSPKPDYCECSFVMIMRGENDVPYCAECKKEVNESPEISSLEDIIASHEKDIENLKALTIRLESRLQKANQYLEANGMEVSF